MKTVSSFVSDADRADSARIAYKTAADIVGKAVMLAIVVAAARRLPRETFGALTLAVSVGWMAGVASDMGLPLSLARTVAREPRSLGPALATVLRLRLALATAAMAVVTLAAWLLAPEGGRMAFVLIAGSQIAAATFETLGHALRGLGRAELETHVHLAQRIAMGVLALVVLARAPSLLLLGVALIAPPALAVPALLAVIRAQPEQRAVGGAVGVEPASVVLRRAAPLGAAIMLSALYFRIDVVFVERTHGIAAVAGYAAVFRVVDAIRLLPAAAMAVLFPALCRAEDVSVLRRVGAALAIPGVAAGVLVAAAAEPIVTTVYGAAFLDAVPVLRLLALSVPLFFVNYALTNQVIGWGAQRAYLGITAAALAGNLVFNGLLVPPYGASGAAIATALTELIVTLGCLSALASSAHPRADAVHAPSEEPA